MKKTAFWKQLLLHGGIVLLLIFSGCVIEPHSDDHVHSNRYSAKDSFSFQINPTGQTRLALDAINGTVEIIGSSDSSIVEIWGDRIVESDSRRDAQNYLEKLDVEIIQRTGEIFVQTIQPGHTNGRNFLVHYCISLPRDWDVDVFMNNGDIKVANIDGTVETELDNGELTLENVYNTIDVQMANGNMYLKNIVGSIDADLTNGNIEARMTLPAFGDCELRTVNGQIYLHIPTSTSAAFNAGVTNGSIALRNLVLHNEHSTQRSKSGTLGNGDGRIDLKTTNGTITVDGF